MNERFGRCGHGNGFPCGLCLKGVPKPPHSDDCVTKAGALSNGSYCCDTFAVDYIWTRAELGAGQ